MSLNVEFFRNWPKRAALAVALAAVLLAAGCPAGTDSTGDALFALDETDAAVTTVKAANETLKQIRQRFRDNEPRLADLQTALREKNAPKVRELTESLSSEIIAGTESGKEAVAQLRTARGMNIGGDFREYLDLKILALEKYIEAFDERRRAAILLRDGYDPKNAARREQVVAAFKEREDKFQTIMEEARQISEEANEIARLSLVREKTK